MILHVLPGDAIVPQFGEIGLEGEIVVCRESLIEGPVEADDLHEFWTRREEYFSSADVESDQSYATSVASEFGKLIELPVGSVVNLWFEYELFCQVNMWFCLYLLRSTRADVFRVAPVVRNDSEKWKGFGGLEPGPLKECFAKRTQLDRTEIALGSELWKVYRSGDREGLQELAAGASERVFPYLSEVCKAAAAMDTMPKEILREITAGGLTEFADIFRAFSEKAGVYGFGDLQVKGLLATL